MKLPKRYGGKAISNKYVLRSLRTVAIVSEGLIVIGSHIQYIYDICISTGVLPEGRDGLRALVSSCTVDSSLSLRLSSVPNVSTWAAAAFIADTATNHSFCYLY